MRRAKRIHQVITAVSKEGPLPVPDLVDKVPGIESPDHLRKIVLRAKEAGILEYGTRGWDLPKAMTAVRGNATCYTGVVSSAGCVMGLNVGRTYFAIGVADPNGRLLSSVRKSPPRGKSKAAIAAQEKHRRGQIVTHTREEGTDGATLLNHIAGMAREWMGKVGVKPADIRGITLSLPAPVNTPGSRLLTRSIEGSLGAVPHIASHLENALGEEFVNLRKVVVSNDADVAARAEVRYGDAYGKSDVVVVHAAYGIGAGVLAEGAVLRTGAGGGIGEIGHCVQRVVRDEGKQYGLRPLDPDDPFFRCACQQVGHLEALAGGDAIIRRLRRSDGVDPEPPPELAALLAKPQTNAARLLDEILVSGFSDDPWQPGRAAVLDAGHLIGGAIHTLTHVLRPDAVYVSGKLSEAGADFLTEVRNGFTESGPLAGYEPEIALGTAADQFGRRHVMVRGAAMTAMRAAPSLIDVDRVQEMLDACPSEDDEAE